MIEEFIEWIQNNGWDIELSEKENDFPEEERSRYGKIPEQWLNFASKFNYISNSEGNIWFLTCYDFTDFCNDFEDMSLEAASDDDEWKKRITNFWDKTIPIVMSVGGDYYYYGIDIETGKIVVAYEPEFEEVVEVADTFDAFIRKIISGEILLL